MNPREFLSGSSAVRVSPQFGEEGARDDAQLSSGEVELAVRVHVHRVRKWSLGMWMNSAWADKCNTMGT